MLKLKKHPRTEKPGRVPPPKKREEASRSAPSSKVCPLTTDEIVGRVVHVAEAMAEKKFYPYQTDFAWGVAENVIERSGAELTALFSRQCLAEGTIISDRSGVPHAIEDYPDSWETGVRECYHVKARGYDVVATGNHPFLTPEGWRKLEDIGVGDFVAVLTGHSGEGSCEITKSLTVDGRYPISCSVQVGLTEDHGKLLAYLVADDSLPKNGQSTKFTNTTEEYLQEVEELVRKLFPGVEAKRYPKGKGFDITFTHPSRRLAVNPLNLYLRSLDYLEGFPVDIFRSPHRTKCAFLNRMTASDGYVHVRKNGQVEVGISCGLSEAYARCVQLLLAHVGVVSRVKSEFMHKSTSLFFRVIVTGDPECSTFLGNVGPVLGKEEACERAAKCIRSRRVGQLLGSGKGRCRKALYAPASPEIVMDGEQLSWVRVTSIEPCGKRRVYDCAFPGKHWFIAQGFAVHNSGKSETIADISAALAITLPALARAFPEDPRLNRTDAQGRYRGYMHGFRIGIYAPILEQADITFKRLKDAFSTETARRLMYELGTEYEVNRGDTLVLAKKGFGGKKEWASRVKCASASKNANVEGATHDLLILEESQDLEDLKITKSLSPMVASTKGLQVFVGTAGTRKCTFLRAIARNKRHEIWHGGKRHFFYPADVCAKYNSDYADYVDLERERLGEDSDAFRMSYMCIFVLERGMFVTEKFLLDQRVALEVGPFSEIMPTDTIDAHLPPQYDVVAGIDFARDSDSTVVTLMAVDWRRPLIEQMIPDPDRPGSLKMFRLFQKHVIGWMELHGDSYEAQFQDIYSALSRVRRLRKIRVDGTGLGGPLYDRFSAVYQGTSVEVEAHIFTEKTNSEAAKQLLSDIIQARVTFPYSQKTRDHHCLRKFVVEMLDAEKTIKKNGNMVVAAPDEPDAHDDYVDSLMLANLAANEPSGSGRIQVISDFSFFRR